jgi:hypothetical protein
MMCLQDDNANVHEEIFHVHAKVMFIHSIQST